MTAKEAADFTGYTPDYISRLCREGRLPDAQMAGDKLWLVPLQSVIDYKPGPQGFAATQAKKQEEAREQEAAALAEQNEAIRLAKGLLKDGDTNPQDTPTVDGDDSAATVSLNSNYVTVKDAAKMLNRPYHYVRRICSWGRIPGAYKLRKSKEWLIPYDELKKFYVSMRSRIKRPELHVACEPEDNH